MLVAVFTLWASQVDIVASTDEELKLVYSLIAGVTGFLTSFFLLSSTIKAMFPLGALISGLIQ
jgi:hypothetical protein